MIFAVVRLRGIRNIKPRIRKTLELLRLNKPNHCVIVPDTPQYRGMLNVCKDYIAYGSISEETLAKLIEKRGEKGSKRIVDLMESEEIKKLAKKIMHGEKVKEVLDPVFRLHPPRKGMKSIKLHYPFGELGKRDSMDSLIKRMM